MLQAISLPLPTTRHGQQSDCRAEEGMYGSELSARFTSFRALHRAFIDS